MDNCNDFFIDIGVGQKEKYAQQICGDVFITKKINSENRTIAVLSDGLGSGVKANILATMTASMALNFIAANSPLGHTANIIMETLPIDRERKIGFSSFTIIDIESDGLFHIIEFGNPPTVIWRNNDILSLPKEEIKTKNKYKLTQKLFYTNYPGKKNDRILLFSDGITQSGIGSKSYPFGWGAKNIHDFLRKEITRLPSISSLALSNKILSRAWMNDCYKAKDDITAVSIYLREPRRLMLCSGPPYDETKDAQLARDLEQFNGTKVVCGGTTANIIARELKRTISTPITGYSHELPPVSMIENIDLVTEGILTLGKSLNILENGIAQEKHEINAAMLLCKELIDHDEIYFVVGTKINEAHQDPSLPVELEIRRNVIKKMTQVLDSKYLKRVYTTYI